MTLINTTADLIEFLEEGIPAKRSQFRRLIQELRVAFLFDPSAEELVFSADSQQRLVKVGQQGMVRVWVHAFAYCHAFAAIPAKLRSGGTDREEQDALDSVLRRCSELLTWAVRADLAPEENAASHKPEPLPIPSPFDAPPGDGVYAMAQGVWGFSLSFILFHELTHVQRGHVRERGILNIEQERDADREAGVWLLEDNEGTPRQQLLRGMGVATALLFLVTFDVYRPGSQGDSYPTRYDRLWHTLSQYYHDGSETSEQVWCYVATVLLLHMRNNGLLSGHLDWPGSWRAVADHLVNLLSRRS